MKNLNLNNNNNINKNNNENKNLSIIEQIANLTSIYNALTFIKFLKITIRMRPWNTLN